MASIERPGGLRSEEEIAERVEELQRKIGEHEIYIPSNSGASVKPPQIQKAQDLLRAAKNELDWVLGGPLRPDL